MLHDGSNYEEGQGIKLAATLRYGWTGEFTRRQNKVWIEDRYHSEAAKLFGWDCVLADLIVRKLITTRAEAWDFFVQTNPDWQIEDLDAVFHDDLPEDKNCPLCGVEHASLNREEN